MNKEFLFDLLKTGSVSGNETELEKKIYDYMQDKADLVEVDELGNVTAAINPDAPFKVLVTGHADEIGLMVSAIGSDGMLMVTKIGGIYPTTYPGHKVRIYTKNGVSLILCPQGKTGTVSVKKGTATIWQHAFDGQLRASKVVIPEGVITIRKGNFVSYRKDVLEVELPKSLEKIYPDMFRSPTGYRVRCSKGSTAETFVLSRGVELKK